MLAANQTVRHLVDKITSDQKLEIFEIYAGSKTVVVRTNYNKRTGNKKIDWKLESGGIHNVEAFVSTLRAMEHYFREIKQ